MTVEVFYFTSIILGKIMGKGALGCLDKSFWMSANETIEGQALANQRRSFFPII